MAERRIAYLVGLQPVVLNQPVGPEFEQARIRIGGSQACLGGVNKRYLWR
jgi:hypothetical protein